MQFEQDAVSQGLTVGLTLHEGLDLIPRSRPVEPQSDLPGSRSRMLGENLLDLRETVGVVGDDLLQSALKIGESVLMGGKDLLGAQVLHFEQGLEEVTQWIGE